MVHNKRKLVKWVGGLFHVLDAGAELSQKKMQLNEFWSFFVNSFGKFVKSCILLLSEVYRLCDVSVAGVVRCIVVCWERCQGNALWLRWEAWLCADCSVSWVQNGLLGTVSFVVHSIFMSVLSRHYSVFAFHIRRPICKKDESHQITADHIFAISSSLVTFCIHAYMSLYN